MPRKASAKPSSAAKAPPPPDQQEPEVEAEDSGTEAAVSPTDNVGDISVEVNVEDLIAQIESEAKGEAPDGSARRKIEDILEEKRVRRETMDLDDLDIDE